MSFFYIAFLFSLFLLILSFLLFLFNSEFYLSIYKLSLLVPVIVICYYVLRGSML